MIKFMEVIMYQFSWFSKTPKFNFLFQILKITPSHNYFPPTNFQPPLWARIPH